MLCSINENELTLYKVELNKNRLKAIRKSIIAKYGKINVTYINISIKDFYNIVEKRNDIIATDVGIRENKVSFISIEIPKLAIVLNNILKGQEDAIYELETYRSYYDFLDKRSSQENNELQQDQLGTIYIKKILENMKLVPVKKENCTDIFDVLYKLKHSEDENLQKSAQEMEKILVPNNLVGEIDTTQKTKKIGTIEKKKASTL